MSNTPILLHNITNNDIISPAHCHAGPSAHRPSAEHWHCCCGSPAAADGYSYLCGCIGWSNVWNCYWYSWNLLCGCCIADYFLAWISTVWRPVVWGGWALGVGFLFRGFCRIRGIIFCWVCLIGTGWIIRCCSAVPASSRSTTIYDSLQVGICCWASVDGCSY